MAVASQTGSSSQCLPHEVADRAVSRDRLLRNGYLTAALADIPRLLGAIDRNPYRPTYGCLDREFWHYRTAAFPSQMYQEGVLALALVYATELPGNRWYRDGRVRELAVAGIRFAAASSHRDGSCDDYYPFERALGAAVFSLQAVARAYQLLELDDAEIVAWLERRSRWIMRSGESGRLANHHALAALGLLRVAEITGRSDFRDAGRLRLSTVLAWQSDEGWFEEYGGADPGYQTVTIDCLAKCRAMTGDAWLDGPLRRAVGFARLFLHPDDSYAGEYGSRGTYHFYPHGMELLAGDNPEAADLADAHLRSLAAGRQACFADDRMVVHRPANLIEAWLDWSPARPLAPEPLRPEPTRYLPHAQLLVRRSGHEHTVVSAARGGVFKHFSARTLTTSVGGDSVGDGDSVGNQPARSVQLPTKSAPSCVTDAGLVVETATGRVAVSQQFDPQRSIELPFGTDPHDGSQLDRLFSISGTLCWARFPTATPMRQAVFHVGMWVVGRWCRALVRRLLQWLVITGRRPCPMHLTRTFEFLPEGDPGRPRLRVTDSIELTSPWIKVRRMAFGTDHQAAYVAASGVYQDSVLRPWTDLAEHVEELNARRQVTVVREF
jgi:hypothetical protein